MGNRNTAKLRKLKEVLTYAADNIPWYRQRFISLGIDVAKLNKISDMGMLPLLSKKELVALSSTTESNFAKQDLFYIGFTTGTTSVPMPVYYTKSDFAEWEQLLITAFGWGDTGVRSHGTVGLAIGRFGINALALIEATRKSGMTVMFIDTDIIGIDGLIRMLNDFQVTILFTFPSLVRELAIRIQETNQGYPRSLRQIFTGGEPWAETLRKLVKNVLNVEIYDIYGSSEAGLIGFECSHHTGLHITAHHNIVEIIDPKTGMESKPGEYGEIVVTSLWRKGIPLIRYRTGDLSAWSNVTCPCGLSYPIISRVRGRIDDLIFFGSTKIDPVSIEELITAKFGQSLGFQVVLDRVGGRDRLIIRLEVQAEISDVESKAREFLDSFSRITEDVAYIIQTKLVHEPMIEIVSKGHLERSGERKTPRLIDRRSR